MSHFILTQDQLKQLLTYDKQTGSFHWVKRNQRLAGSTNKVQGYRSIHIKGKNYKCSRLAWLYVYGAMPTHQIDHINHVRGDNRISNLREVTNQENQRNRRYTGNSSGVIGVCLDKTRNKWKPHIKVDGKLINLGRFDKLEDAVKVRRLAEVEYGFHTNHGMKLTV